MSDNQADHINADREPRGTNDPLRKDWKPDDHRKDKRLEIAKFTIKLGLIGAMVFGICFMILFSFNTFHFKKDIKDEIYFLSLIFTALFNIITLSIGFVAGSSID